MLLNPTMTFAMPILAGALALVSGSAAAQSVTNGLPDYLARQDKTYVCQTDDGKSRTMSVPASAAAEIIGHGGYLGPCAVRGDHLAMGNGYFETYTQMTPDGVLWGIGFRFPETTLDDLPAVQYDGLNCFDTNGDGQLEINGPTSDGVQQIDECSGGHERALQLPLQQATAPFKWGLVNWQMHGHSPDHVYTVPHFDFHFYTQDFEERNFIRVGPCALLVDCADYAKGRRPVPAGYLPPEFLDVGAVESRMGNHLIDVTAPEWNNGTFSETWMYGIYDGKVTFWEPMITRAYFLSKPFMCKQLKLPQHYQQAGNYPTEYCIRYRAERHEYTVSLEGFVARAAN